MQPAVNDADLQTARIEQHEPPTRLQRAAEEVANSAGHGVRLLLAVVVLPMLVQASQAGVGLHLHLTAACVFAGTMILLYLSSALFHRLPPSRGKQLFGKLDHAAAYLLSSQVAARRSRPLPRKTHGPG